jgi:hypothetical protein
MEIEWDEGKVLACCATLESDAVIEADIDEDPDVRRSAVLLATRCGLAMAYGMPEPESTKLMAWYEKICHCKAFQATAPPRVIAALDRGWQASTKRQRNPQSSRTRTTRR